MYFRHSAEVWREYPELVAGVLRVDHVSTQMGVEPRLQAFYTRAEARLASASESELPEIQAWRRAFSRMGLKPTQYRCASESLLRRFRKEKSLPRLHPLVDLCNAISLAFAIPVAALDISKIADHLDVRHADGSESYSTFTGEIEHPAAGEVIFADGAGRAHARRWTNRQSGDSAVRDETREVLVVAEAMHASARDDVPHLIATLLEELEIAKIRTLDSAILTEASPRFEF